MLGWMMVSKTVASTGAKLVVTMIGWRVATSADPTAVLWVVKLVVASAK